MIKIRHALGHIIAFNVNIQVVNSDIRQSAQYSKGAYTLYHLSELAVHI